MQNLLTLKALYIKGFMVFEMAFRARKLSGTFEKRAPGPDSSGQVSKSERKDVLQKKFENGQHQENLVKSIHV